MRIERDLYLVGSGTMGFDMTDHYDCNIFGGKIVLQKTYDCSVSQTIDTIERLGDYSFEALLPGHLNFSLNNGKRHIEKARGITDRFGCPPSIT